MKVAKIVLLSSITFASALPFMFVRNDIKKAEAAYETDMSKVGLIIGESFDTSNIFYDDFSSSSLDANWAISNRAWGGFGNHGVVADNVYLNTKNDKLIIKCLGNQYLETSTVNNLGGPISGGAIIMKKVARPGRYEVKMKLAYKVGVCSAFWTYTEDGSGNNHEIDIEIPPKDNYGNNVFNRALFTNWIGETNYDQKNAQLNFYLNDGEYHTYAFDWYYSSSHKLIRYYIDGVRYATLEDVSKVPYLPSRLWLGGWIPNNSGFVGLPDFDKCYMEVDYVKYTPFLNQMPVTQGSAGGYGQTSTNYHITQDDFEYDWMSNGTFHSIAKNSNLSARGYTTSGTVALSNNYGNGNTSTSGGVRISANSSMNYNVNSIVPGAKYALSNDYKGAGQLKLSYYGLSKQLLKTETISLPSSAAYTSIRNVITVPASTLYVTTSYQTGAGQELYLDNLKMLLTKEEPEPEPEPEPSSSEVPPSSEAPSSELPSSSLPRSESSVLPSSEIPSSEASSSEVIPSSEQPISSEVPTSEIPSSSIRPSEKPSTSEMVTSEAPSSASSSESKDTPVPITNNETRSFFIGAGVGAAVVALLFTMITLAIKRKK